jgi:hypothetical protein
VLDFLGALVALAIFAVPVWVMITFFVGAANDYGKPSRRRRRKSYSSNSRKRYANYGPRSEFQYVDNEAPGEFVVYFIENPKLRALKIGVGRAGRVHQLLNSFVDRSETSERIGWQVLRVAQFSWSSDDYEKGREKAYEAERRVKFYWKSQGNEPFLRDEQMGFSQVTKRSTDEVIWIRTQGWSETVEMGKICEVSSWKYVTSAPGFIGELTEFEEGRELLLLNQKHADRTRPPDLKFPVKKKSSSSSKAVEQGEEIAGALSVKPVRSNRTRPKSDGTQQGAFLARTQPANEAGCILWSGAAQTDSGYGTMLWNGTPTPAHRIAWMLDFNEDLENAFLANKCGNRLCVNTQHWDKVVKSEFTCVTNFCEEPSRTTYKQGQCEKCFQRAKVIRRAVREGTASKCPTVSCKNMSTSSASNSRCVECAAKFRASKANS